MMINLDNTIKKNKLLLSIRDVNTTQSPQNCKPKESCPKTCSPSCNDSQVCAYKTITECGVCPPTYCMENKQLRVNSFEDNGVDSSNEFKKTALIAGLTTGLVVLALIIATVAGFVFYKRRKVRQCEESMRKEYSIYQQPPTPDSSIIPPPMAYLPPISENLKPLDTPLHYSQVNYDDPQSPFIIGAQSLQIPHLDDISTATTTPDPSIIRRSLNIQSTTTPFINHGLGRASSVKVTKFDKRFNNTTHSSEDDLDDTMFRRAVAVRKHDSFVSRVGSGDNNDIVYAKPTMVRINTVLKRDQQSGLIRKTSIRTVIEDDSNNRMDFYLCPPPIQQPSSNNPSQVSVQSSTSSHSTVGDGSIIVYLEPPTPSP